MCSSASTWFDWKLDITNSIISQIWATRWPLRVRWQRRIPALTWSSTAVAVQLPCSRQSSGSTWAANWWCSELQIPKRSWSKWYANATWHESKLNLFCHRRSVEQNFSLRRDEEGADHSGCAHQPLHIPRGHLHTRDDGSKVGKGIYFSPKILFFFAFVWQIFGLRQAWSENLQLEWI